MQNLNQTINLQMIFLNPPDKRRGLPFMEAISVKASAVEWSDEDLTMQDLSDLLWSANGINRPEIPKFSASAAMNAHDVDLYLFMKNGVYLYDAGCHAINPLMEGDYRSELMMPPPVRPPEPAGSPPRPRPAVTNPPLQLILISDSSRFRGGTPEQRYEWGAIDTGIVSQNISLFCAATGLKTRPRASVDKQKIRQLLNLSDSQHIFLNHPVGYQK